MLIAAAFFALSTPAGAESSCPPFEVWRSSYEALRQECSAAYDEQGVPALRLAEAVRKQLEGARTHARSALDSFDELRKDCAKEKGGCGEGLSSVEPVGDSLKGIDDRLAEASRGADAAGRECERRSLKACADRLSATFSAERGILLDGLPALKDRLDHLEESRLGDLPDAARTRLERLMPDARAGWQAVQDALSKGWCDRAPCPTTPHAASCLTAAAAYRKAAEAAHDAAARAGDEPRAKARRLGQEVVPLLSELDKAKTAIGDPSGNDGRNYLEWLAALAAAQERARSDPFRREEPGPFCGVAPKAPERPSEAAPTGPEACAVSPLAPECQSYCRDNPDEFVCVLPLTCANQPDLDQCRPATP